MLNASRELKTRVLVTEDFTERTQTARQKLVNFAKSSSNSNRCVLRLVATERFRELKEF